jgi:hypothetical protein
MTGIEPTGNMVKQPAKFTVDTISAGQGDVMVFVEDPEGNKEEVRWRMPPPSGVIRPVTRPETAYSGPHNTQPKSYQRIPRLVAAEAAA